MSRWPRSHSATGSSCRACPARSTTSTGPTIRAAVRPTTSTTSGINLGGFLAPLICGTLGELYGWHYGFGAAGIGMFVGLLIYLAGGKYLPAETPSERRQNPLPPRAAAIRESCPVAAPGSRNRGHSSSAAPMSKSATPFPSGRTSESIGRWVDSAIPMTWFQSLNPLLVITLTPLLLLYWRRQADAGRDTPPARRMAIGALIVAGAYLLLAAVSTIAGANRASWLWLRPILSHLHPWRALHPADRPGTFCAAGATPPRRNDSRGLVFGHLQRQHVGRRRRDSLELGQPWPFLRSAGKPRSRSLLSCSGYSTVQFGALNSKFSVATGRLKQRDSRQNILKYFSNWD